MYRVLDTDKDDWWNYMVGNGVFKSMWDTVEQAQYAVDCATVDHEFPPVSYDIKACVVSVVQGNETTH